MHEGYDEPDLSVRDMAVAAGIIAGAYTVGKFVHKAAECIGIPGSVGGTLSVGAVVGTVMLVNETTAFVRSFGEIMDNQVEDMDARIG